MLTWVVWCNCDPYALGALRVLYLPLKSAHLLWREETSVLAYCSNDYRNFHQISRDLQLGSSLTEEPHILKIGQRNWGKSLMPRFYSCCY